MDALVFDLSTYQTMDSIDAWCLGLAHTLPEWISLETLGRSRAGRPIYLVTLGLQEDNPNTKPTLWIDAGTHASEWTGVSAALHVLSTWSQALARNEPEAVAWFSSHTVAVVPCVSPDGYQALFDGAPYLRSTLRPPRQGGYRSGLDPCDVDGDGVVRWMRWKHPSGPFVQDEEVPLLMRPRTLDDSPEDAFFVCDEGVFLNWDGVSWNPAPRAFGVDLNRNFPAHWQPFSMFGMDGGAFSLSEPESRALTDAFAARSTISCALSLHTYTGCILTQPYRDPSPLPKSDIVLMERLAQNAVRDTPYRTFRVHPEFTYDPKQSIVGVWSDTISTVFGLPGYTLELWDPYAYAERTVERPAASFVHPDIDTLRALLQAFLSKDPDSCTHWRRVAHPQLGDVEVGGIDYLRTVRNPPERLLAQECATTLRIADRMRAALCRVTPSHRLRTIAEHTFELTFDLENQGFLSTAGLHYAEEIGACPHSIASLQLPPSLTLLTGSAQQPLPQLAGWGTLQTHGSHHPIYSALSTQPHRARARWVIQGQGHVKISWSAGRGGSGVYTLEVNT